MHYICLIFSSNDEIDREIAYEKLWEKADP